MIYEKIQTLLSDYRQHSGIAPELSVDVNGVCEFVIDGTSITLHADVESEEILLFSMIGRVPERSRRETAVELADANVLWSRTNRATLSMDNDSGMVFVAARQSFIELDKDRFAKFIESFLQTAQQWARWLDPPSDEISDFPPPHTKV
jgi:hypothetical protein